MKQVNEPGNVRVKKEMFLGFIYKREPDNKYKIEEGE